MGRTIVAYQPTMPRDECRAFGRYARKLGFSDGQGDGRELNLGPAGMRKRLLIMLMRDINGIEIDETLDHGSLARHAEQLWLSGQLGDRQDPRTIAENEPIDILITQAKRLGISIKGMTAVEMRKAIAEKEHGHSDGAKSGSAGEPQHRNPPGRSRKSLQQVGTE